MPVVHKEYELFISYARADNTTGWIKSYVDALEEEYRRFTGGRELRIFFDTERIPDFSHWEAEIFNKGIGVSKLFLAFLSPNYFASEVCRREWRAWVEREIGMHIFTEGAAPIYIVEIPAMFGKPMPPEHETARQIAELCNLPLPHDLFVRDAESVVRQFRRRQLHAVQLFYTAGLKALQQDDLRQQLQSLGKTLDARIDDLSKAAASESTVPPYNPKFTGRVDELVELRSLLVNNHTGVVAGIHGLGGIGKTELAFTFAHAYASVYPGGRYYVRCENQSSLPAAFTRLEDDPFHAEISEGERQDEQANFNAVCRCLKKRLAEKGPLLLVLDNVSNPAILHADQTGRLTKLGPKLHLLATTRLPQARGIKTLMLGEMKPIDAVALLEKFRPFRDDADRVAAEAIVERLGGFALAVELVAARMAAHASATYAGVLEGLGLDKLEGYAHDPDVQLMRHRHEKRLRSVLEPTLAELSPQAHCLLQFAALLPPDRIVFPWLRDLVLAEYPELARRGPDGDDPWFELVHSLFRLSLFNGVVGADELPATARLHRLIGDHLRLQISDSKGKTLQNFLALRAESVWRQQEPPADWELDGLLEAIPFLLDANADRQLAVEGTFLVDKVRDYRSLPLAQTLLRSTHAFHECLAAADPANADCQRNLSMSFDYLGNLSVAQGDLPAAARHFTAGLQISERLAAADPFNADWQRNLSISFERLGDLAVAQGELPAAARHFTANLKISERLAAADSANATWQHGLSVSFTKLGDLAVAQGDLPAAARHFTAGLKISETLAAADPTNAVWQRNMSVSFTKLGGLAVAQGDLPAAARHFTAGLKISETLAAADPANAEWQRDLSISFERLGAMAVGQGDLHAAAGHFTASLKISERLAASDPANVGWQRDLAVSFGKLGELAVAQGDLPAAARHFTAGLKISERLAASDPANVKWQRDLSVSFNNLGDLAVAQGDLPAAARHFSASSKISNRLAASDPANAEWQSDLSISYNRLGDLAVGQGDLPAAARHYGEYMKIRERLAASDPANADWQRVLWMSFGKLGDLANAQGDIPESLRRWTSANKITIRLAASDPANEEWQRELSVSFEKLGNLTVAQGDLPAAARHFTACLEIRERLAALDPANAAWQRDLAVSFNWLGNLAVAQGDLPTAARYYGEYTKISDRLAAADPSNAEWQRNLTVSFIKLGDLAFAQGDLPAAARHFTAGLKISERLAASDPANAAWQRDLAASFSRLGHLAGAQEDLPGAARHFTASLKISERLAASDPANATWQRDLSVSLEKLGILAVAQGDLPNAARHFNAGLKISETLAAGDPANADWQRDLSVSFNKLGDLAVAQGDLPDAARHFNAGLKIRETLAAAAPTNAEWQRDIAVSFSKIASLLEKEGKPEAVEYWRKCLGVFQAMIDAGLHLTPQDLGRLEWLRAKLGGVDNYASQIQAMGINDPDVHRSLNALMPESGILEGIPNIAQSDDSQETKQPSTDSVLTPVVNDSSDGTSVLLDVAKISAFIFGIVGAIVFLSWLTRFLR